MTHETLTNETLEEKLAEKNQNQNRDYALWTGIVLTILGWWRSPCPSFLPFLRKPGWR